MTKRNTDSVERQSTNPIGERIEQLKQLFPEAVAEDGIDFELLANLLGKEEVRKEHFNFSWVGKQEAILNLQKQSKATLQSVPGESINWESTRNIYIEGDNLEVMKLLYKSYFGQVKMIYIDPPYNTGNDFVYPDNYSDPLHSYLEITQQKDKNGTLLTSNVETNGRFHSNWLTMMYPRLFLARQFLANDGLIFVSIDDHEVHNLRSLMDQIFGVESFLACFIWHRRQMPDSRNTDRVSTDHEYVLAYRRSNAVLTGKDIDVSKYSNPDNDSRGAWFSADLTGLANKEQRPNLHYDITNPETGITYPPSPTRGWAVSKTTFESMIKDNRVLWPSKPTGRPRRKSFLNERTDLMTSFSTILDVGYTTEGTRELQELFGEKIFQFPKPVSLIKELVRQGTSAENGDIVLDFFAGSSTTAQAILELNREDGGNRQFILVQLPEPTNQDGFPTIADIGKERIKRVIGQLNTDINGKLQGLESTSLDLGFRAFKLSRSLVRQWDELNADETSPEEYERQLELFVQQPLVDGWTEQDVISEVAIKEAGFGLSYSVRRMEEIEDQSVFIVTDDERDQQFYICLDDTISLDALRPLELSREDLFIFRDSAINDTIIANLALTCRIKSI